MRFIIGVAGFMIADSVNTEVFTATIMQSPNMFLIILIGMLSMDVVELITQ